MLYNFDNVAQNANEAKMASANVSAVGQVMSAQQSAEASKYGARSQAGTAANALAEQQRQYDIRAGMYKDWLAQSQKNQSGISSLLDQYNQAYNTAKAQNETKYNQQLGLVDQITGQQRADTIANTQRQQSDAMQNLARLGMANTSGAPTITAGIQRQGQGALNNLADQMAREKLGVMQGFNYQGIDPQVTTAAMNNATQMATRPFSF